MPDELDVTTSVENIGVVDDIEDAITQGIVQSGTAIGDEMEYTAKERILDAGAVWTGELISSFDVSYRTEGNKLVVTLSNDADHARPIEFGAEYGERGPPVAALIPWVRTHLMGMTLDREPRGNLSGEAVDDELEVEGPSGERVDVREFSDPEVIDRAFWLQQHIKENGLDAVRFMETAEQFIEESGDDVTAEWISVNLRRL
jgi:hypothetical protein